MLEEAVSTLKEQVNIYEQEVDQVILSFNNQSSNWLSYDISDQRTITDKGIQLWRRNIHPKNTGTTKKKSMRKRIRAIF